MKDEDVTSAPYSKTKNIMVSGLTKAVLNWSFTERAWGVAEYHGISLNNNFVSEKSSGSQDVTDYVIDQGENTVLLEVKPWLIPFFIGSLGKANVYLTITARERVTEKEPIEVPEIPMWMWIIVAIMVFVVIAYVVVQLYTKRSPIALGSEMLKGLLK